MCATTCSRSPTEAAALVKSPRFEGACYADEKSEFGVREAKSSLVAVGIFLTTHVAVVLHVAFGEIFSDILVALNVSGSQVSVFVSIDGVEISMRCGFALRIVLAFISGVGGCACEEQCGAGQ